MKRKKRSKLSEFNEELLWAQSREVLRLGRLTRKLEREARIRHIPSVKDLLVVHEVEERLEKISNLMHLFRKEFTREVMYKLRNGWGDKIRKTMKSSLPKEICPPALINKLKHKWHCADRR